MGLALLPKRSQIFLVDAEHLSQALVPEIYVSSIHLVQNELVTIMTLLAKLGF